MDNSTESISKLLENNFKIAINIVNNFKKTPSNEELLNVYKYYKQATVGDINIEKPGFLNFKSKSKWNAWNEIKGMSKEDAKVNYVNLAMEYGEKYN